MRVVFTPDLLGAAFLDPDCRAMLLLWRDGLLQPVLCRGLLVRYLKTLRALGLTEEILKRWTLWLTAPEKCLYLRESPEVVPGLEQLCLAAAESGGAGCIVSRNSPTVSNASQTVHWISARAFLQEKGFRP